MKTIPLTQGKSALVDDEDFEWLSQWNWCVDERHRKRLPSTYYAVRRHGNSRLPGSKKLYMHKELVRRWGLPRSEQIDHRDGDGLNNQRSNLRPANRVDNYRNKIKSVGFTSRFKGVCWFKATNRWAACIKVMRKNHHLGYFLNEEDAAMAYDKAAQTYFGEFARFNFATGMTATCATL